MKMEDTNKNKNKNKNKKNKKTKKQKKQKKQKKTKDEEGWYIWFLAHSDAPRCTRANAPSNQPMLQAQCKGVLPLQMHL